MTSVLATYRLYFDASGTHGVQIKESLRFVQLFIYLFIKIGTIFGTVQNEAGLISGQSFYSICVSALLLYCPVAPFVFSLFLLLAQSPAYLKEIYLNFFF